MPAFDALGSSPLGDSSGGATFSYSIGNISLWTNWQYIPLVAANGHGYVPSVISLPSITIAAYGGSVGAVTLPSARVSVIAWPSQNIAALSLPGTTASLFGGATASLSSPSCLVGITGTFVGSGGANLRSSTPSISSTGTVSAVGSTSITAPSFSLVAYSGAVISITLTSAPTVFSSSTSGSVAYASITAPLFDLTASATAQNRGSAIIAAPAARLATTGAAWLMAPGAQLTAVGTAVVAVTYEAYALNLKHTTEAVDELTRYTNYPFDKIVRYKNSYFGMNSTGLYLLEGTTDFAEPTPLPIQASWKTSITDFETPNLKSVEMMYVGGRLPATSSISVFVGEAGTESYSHSTPRGAAAQNYRQPFGRGMKSRYYAFGASCMGSMTVDTLTFNVIQLSRKV